MPEIKLTLNEGDAKTVAESLRATHVEWLAEIVEAQLPEAPVEEPTEFGSVVWAGTKDLVGRVRLVRTLEGMRPVKEWCYDVRHYEWSDLRNPEVLRVGVGEPATPPAEAVEAEEAVVVAGRIDAITRDAIDEALRDPSRAENCAAKAHKAVLALLADSPLGATSTVMAEPTPEQVEADVKSCATFLHCTLEDGHTGWCLKPPPEQVEADLAQDEQVHTRYYAQAGVPVEKVREASAKLLRWAKGPEGSLHHGSDAYTKAAILVDCLVPKEPTS